MRGTELWSHLTVAWKGHRLRRLETSAVNLQDGKAISRLKHEHDTCSTSHKLKLQRARHSHKNVTSNPVNKVLTLNFFRHPDKGVVQQTSLDVTTPTTSYLSGWPSLQSDCLRCCLRPPYCCTRHRCRQSSRRRWENQD